MNENSMNPDLHYIFLNMYFTPDIVHVPQTEYNVWLIQKRVLVTNKGFTERQDKGAAHGHTKSGSEQKINKVIHIRLKVYVLQSYPKDSTTH